MRKKFIRFARSDAKYSPGTRIFAMATGGLAPRHAPGMHGHDEESRPSGLDAEASEERMDVDNEVEVTSARTRNCHQKASTSLGEGSLPPVGKNNGRLFRDRLSRTGLGVSWSSSSGVSCACGALAT